MAAIERSVMGSLTFRDIAGYIVPGTVFLAVLLEFLSGFVGLATSLWDTGIGIVLLFLLASYVAGHLIRVLEWILMHGGTGRQRTQLVTRVYEVDTSVFSPEFVLRLAGYVERTFGLPLSNPDVFPLCRAYTVQHGTSHHYERKLALGHLLSGLHTVAWIGIAFSMLTILKHLLLLLLPLFNVIIPVTAFLDFDEAHLIVSIVSLLVFALLVRPLKSRARHYVKEEVESVYYEFYAVCSGQNQDSVA
jgi:hypothetical protein